MHPLPSHPSIHFHVLPGTYDAFDPANFTTIKSDLVGYPMLSSGVATKEAQGITREFFAQHLGH